MAEAARATGLVFITGIIRYVLMKLRVHLALF